MTRYFFPIILFLVINSHVTFAEKLLIVHPLFAGSHIGHLTDFGIHLVENRGHSVTQIIFRVSFERLSFNSNCFKRSNLFQNANGPDLSRVEHLKNYTLIELGCVNSFGLCNGMINEYGEFSAAKDIAKSVLLIEILQIFKCFFCN